MARKLMDILFRRNRIIEEYVEPSIQDPIPDNNDNIPLLIQHHVLVHDAHGRRFRRANHTLITVPSTVNLEYLRSRIEYSLSDDGNPNGEDYIRYHGERVGRLCVHWGESARGNGFPATTVLCEENLEAALLFLRDGRGYDFVEVRVDLV